MKPLILTMLLLTSPGCTTTSRMAWYDPLRTPEDAWSDLSISKLAARQQVDPYGIANLGIGDGWTRISTAGSITDLTRTMMRGLGWSPVLRETITNQPSAWPKY